MYTLPPPLIALSLSHSVFLLMKSGSNSNRQQQEDESILLCVLSTYLKTLNKCFVNVCLLKSLMCTARKTRKKPTTKFKSNTIFQVLLTVLLLLLLLCRKVKTAKTFSTHTHDARTRERKNLCMCVCVCVSGW